MDDLLGISDSSPIPIDLLLVGRTGNGKSSTGNSILGNKEFAPSCSVAIVSQQAIKATNTIDNRVITVVDGIEIGDEGTRNTKDVEKACKMADGAFSICPGGFSALLVLLKYGVRFTKQEQDAIQMISSVFGEDVVQSHAIFVMTHGDNFDMDDEDEERSFEQWCQEQSGVIKSLYEESGQRWVLFDNKTKDEAKKKKQLNILLSLVQQLQTQSGRYTEEKYVAAKSHRKKTRLETDTRKLLDDIRQSVDEISRGQNHETDFILHKLESMKTKLQERENRIKQNENTDAMKPLLSQINSLQRDIEIKIGDWERRPKQPSPEPGCCSRCCDWLCAVARAAAGAVCNCCSRCKSTSHYNGIP